MKYCRDTNIIETDEMLWQELQEKYNIKQLKQRNDSDLVIKGASWSSPPPNYGKAFCKYDHWD